MLNKNLEIKKILLLVFFFFAFGLLFVYSSSINLCKTNLFYIKKQIFGFLISILLIFFISSIDAEKIKKYSPILYLISIFLCFATKIKIIGITLNGASRWLNFFFFNFQPVELLKPFYILYLAYIVEKNKFQSIKILNLIFILSSFTTFSLLLQPDFGHVLILIAVTLIIFFSINPKKKIIIFIFLTALISSVIIAISKPYRIKRLLIFLNPWQDPRGSGFQIIQSLIAIANGGFFGVGIGKSFQKISFLPMQNTDFIFSIICEEAGALIGIILITAFFVFTKTGLKLAERVNEKSNFRGLSILGLISLISLQASMNILVSTAAIPTKGIGLPFISYGVSSLIGIGITIGLILSLSKKNI